MKTVTLTRCTFVVVSVKIPNRCQKCNASLADPDSVVEWNWNDVGFYGWIETPSAGHASFETADGLRSKHGGEDFHPFMLMCAECDHVVATSENPRAKVLS